MLVLAIFLLTCCTLLACWYWIAVRRNRRRAIQVLRWIESALAGQGHVVGIRWLSPCRFKVPLRLTSGIFQRAWMLVELTPIQMPLQWALRRARGFNEVVTFQADLDFPPSFSLHVNNFRWFARSSKKSRVDDVTWAFEQSGPFVISTRMDWQKEVSSTMSSLVRGEHRDFSNISFQRRSPHFSVSLPLDSIAPSSPTRSYMFDTMKELAGSSSASLS